MRLVWSSMALMTVVGIALAAAMAQQPQAPKSSTKVEPAAPAKVSSDEEAIHRLIDAVEKSYNAGDAKGLAALFTEDAELVDADGNVTHGREAIEELFGTLFEARPGAKMSIEVESIRSIGPGLLVEDGTTIVTTAPDETPDRSRYTVVHVKQNGQWRMASARDISAVAPSNPERLQQLEWLIGEWVDESPDAVVSSTYRWSDDGNFILNEFSAQVAGRPAISCTRRFGRDPLAKQIRSWVFDSAGGYGEGLWSRDGDRWVIKQRSVTGDGQMMTATNVITKIDADRWGWQSYDRIHGSELTPEIEQVIVVRKPPKPEASAGR